MSRDYLTLEEVVVMHDAAVHEFGGTSGIRDARMLAAAIPPQIGCVGCNCSATVLNVKPRQPEACGSTARGSRPSQDEEQLVHGCDECHLPSTTVVIHRVVACCRR